MGLSKRVLAMVLALVLMLSFAACGGEDTGTSTNDTATSQSTNEDSQIEERVISGTSGITLRMTWLGSGQNKDLLDECLRKYTEETGIGVEVVFIPGSWAEYFTKIQTMVAGGEKLDICNVAIEGFEMIVDTGLAMPIDSWIADHRAEYDSVVQDINENVMAFMNFGGQQYGVPNEWNNVATHINTKLLEEAGLSVPAADWDKDEFLRYAQALTKQREDGTTQYGVAVPNYYFGLQAWLYNNDAAYMTEDFTKSLLLDPATVEIFQFMQDLVYEYQVAPIPESGMDTNQLFIDGNIAMHFAGRWPTNNYVTNDFQDVYVQYAPKFKSNVPVWGGQGVFTLAATEHPEEATALALYLSSAPFIREFMQAGAIPVLNSVAQEVVPALGIPQNSALFFESAPLAKAVQAPAQYAECASLIDRVLSDILVNQADVQTTLQEADAELNMILLDNN